MFTNNPSVIGSGVNAKQICLICAKQFSLCTLLEPLNESTELEFLKIFMYCMDLELDGQEDNGHCIVFCLKCRTALEEWKYSHDQEIRWRLKSRKLKATLTVNLLESCEKLPAGGDCLGSRTNLFQKIRSHMRKHYAATVRLERLDPDLVRSTAEVPGNGIELPDNVSDETIPCGAVDSTEDPNVQNAVQSSVRATESAFVKVERTPSIKIKKENTEASADNDSTSSTRGLELGRTPDAKYDLSNATQVTAAATDNSTVPAEDIQAETDESRNKSSTPSADDFIISTEEQQTLEQSSTQFQDYPVRTLGHVREDPSAPASAIAPGLDTCKKGERSSKFVHVPRSSKLRTKELEGDKFVGFSQRRVTRLKTCKLNGRYTRRVSKMDTGDGPSGNKELASLESACPEPMRIRNSGRTVVSSSRTGTKDGMADPKSRIQLGEVRESSPELPRGPWDETLLLCRRGCGKMVTKRNYKYYHRFSCTGPLIYKCECGRIKKTSGAVRNCRQRHAETCKVAGCGVTVKHNEIRQHMFKAHKIVVLPDKGGRRKRISNPK